MQVTLPIDVVIKSVRKRASQHWINVLSSERQYRKRKIMYDKVEESFGEEMTSVIDTFRNYSFILKSKDTTEEFLKTKLDHEILVKRCFPNSFITSFSFPYYFIGEWLGYEFFVMFPLILHHEPDRKVKHTKLYSNKLKELEELKRLGATEVTLTPEDEKFLDLSIDSF